jgi:hypothetical protein
MLFVNNLVFINLTIADGEIKLYFLKWNWVVIN